MLNDEYISKIAVSKIAVLKNELKNIINNLNNIEKELSTPLQQLQTQQPSQPSPPPLPSQQTPPPQDRLTELMNELQLINERKSKIPEQIDKIKKDELENIKIRKANIIKEKDKIDVQIYGSKDLGKNDPLYVAIYEERQKLFTKLRELSAEYIKLLNLDMSNHIKNYTNEEVTRLEKELNELSTKASQITSNLNQILNDKQKPQQELSQKQKEDGLNNLFDVCTNLVVESHIFYIGNGTTITNRQLDLTNYTFYYFNENDNDSKKLEQNSLLKKNIDNSCNNYNVILVLENVNSITIFRIKNILINIDIAKIYLNVKIINIFNTYDINNILYIEMFIINSFI